ncbi:MAG: SURF1 family protein [Caulobacter sp.]
MTARRFPIGLTIATAISLAILCGLGVWQLKRMAWKSGVLASIASAQTQPPRPITQVPLTPAYRFRRVTLDCPGLASAPFIELYAINTDGVAGHRLVSLCSPVGARTDIMVDRGFVADTVSARPAVTPSATVVHLTGVLREGEQPGAFTPPTQHDLFYVRDIDQMALALGARRHPDVMILAETSSNPEWAALVPTPLPPDIPNRHLEYALTWFGLAGALVAVYAALVRRRTKVA